MNRRGFFASLVAPLVARCAPKRLTAAETGLTAFPSEPAFARLRELHAGFSPYGFTLRYPALTDVQETAVCDFFCDVKAARERQIEQAIADRRYMMP